MKLQYLVVQMYVSQLCCMRSDAGNGKFAEPIRRYLAVPRSSYIRQ